MRMRTTGWFLAALTAAAGLTLTAGREATAMDGHCKERDATAAAWVANTRTFEECKARNQQRDGDNVFDQQGLVWWDVRG